MEDTPVIQLPPGFVEDMSRQLPAGELTAFLRSYEQTYVRGLRLNARKMPADPASVDGLLEPVPWETDARYLAVDSTAGAHPLHEAGAYYIQEPSAMIPVAALDPRPGETVLDLCAAPGGKTTQIAARMAGEGLLVANEPVPKRAQILSRNVERMGVMNALVVSAMPRQLALRWQEGFDAVLVDAPCSGEGMFRRHAETRGEWSVEHRDGCAGRQLEILSSAAEMVRPGGRMVYATCTFSRTENEDVIAAFLASHPEFSTEAFSLPGVAAPSGMLTCYPHRMKGEGQFACLLRRDGDAVRRLAPDTSLPGPDRAQLAALRAFCPGAPQPTALLGDTLLSLPGCPDVRGLRVLRAGVHLGMMKGRVFQPDHAWAMCENAPEMPRVALTEAQALRYQAGEAIEVESAPRGFVLPTLGGLVLGWGKVSDGVMKNHYPKGLRRVVAQGIHDGAEF